MIRRHNWSLPRPLGLLAEATEQDDVAILHVVVVSS